MRKTRSKTTANIRVSPRFFLRLAPTLVVAAAFIISVAAQTTYAAPGDLYESDSGSGNIYKFTPGGTRSTFASGLIAPWGLAFDSAGNLFDGNNDRNGPATIFKFTPGGPRSTFASGLFSPYGLACDSEGNLFEADAGSSNIYKFTPGGMRSTFAFGLLVPVGLAFNTAGNLFEADASSGNIYKFTPDGTRSTFAFGLNVPKGLAFDREGNLFVDDNSGNIYKFTPGGTRSTFASGLSSPYGLAFDSAGNLFEADAGSGHIYKFSPGGARSTFASGLSSPIFLAFEPTPAQVVTTNPATNVASFSATLNGSLNPHGLTTTVYFQYGMTTSYGFTTPVQTQTGNTVRPISANISGLLASHVYHFRIVAHNTGGTSFGSDRTFTTLSPTGPPIVTTKPATFIASFSATLNALLDPHGLATSVHFQYGPTTNYGLTTAPQSYSGNTYLNVSANVNSLTASTTYHFRVVASNSAGTRTGSDKTFTTLTATGLPVVMTNPATNVASFSATLNGSLDPHGLTTSVHFQYGTTTSYGLTTAPQSQSGNTYRNVSANISGLTTHTTYHFRIVANNTAGTRFGSDRTFTTH